jgi:hypothetical protein
MLNFKFYVIKIKKYFKVEKFIEFHIYSFLLTIK